LIEVSQLLEGALKSLGVKGDWDRYRVEARCREWLGPQASQALTGVTLTKGTVTLFFKHSAWLNEMNFRKAEGLAVLQQAFPRLGLKSVRTALTTEKEKRS